MKKIIQKINKGIVTVPIVVALSLGSMVLGGVVVFYTSVSAQDRQISYNRQTAAVLDARVSTVEKNLDTIKTDVKDTNNQITTINMNMNQLLWANGINPKQ